MICKRNELGECVVNCRYFIIKQKEPEKYMCVTLPQGLYGNDTVLIEKSEWERLMSEPKHKIKHNFI